MLVARGRALRLCAAARRATLSRGLGSSQLSREALSSPLLRSPSRLPLRFRHRPNLLLPFGLGGCVAGLGGLAIWRLTGAWTHDPPEDFELPLVPVPKDYVHPYQEWSWHRKAWFAFKRSIFLAYVFTPFLLTSTYLMIFTGSRAWRDCWLEQMHKCMSRAGTAFQKFGQWLSMRPDMFPPDVIEILSQLQVDAPSHSAEISKETLRQQLGYDVDELFDEFSDTPVASGSVGQVHRARMRPEFALDGPGGKLRDVAVKVQHPGVLESSFMDLDILWKVFAFTEGLLRITTPINRSDFQDIVQAQIDFTREAFNLQRFAKNFRDDPNIRFPQVSAKFLTPRVLVETWAEGKIVSGMLEDFDNATLSCKEVLGTLGEKKREVQTRLGHILYDMFMKMMIRDNFVHGDLHGGNILYNEGDDHITVLDAGITTSLDHQTYKPFAKFVYACCTGQSEMVIKSLHKLNAATAEVQWPDFRRDIETTIDKFVNSVRVLKDTPLNAADMFGEMMFAMQRHGLVLKGDVASTLFSICLGEGLLRQLDPTIDIGRGSIPYISKHVFFTA